MMLKLLAAVLAALVVVAGWRLWTYLFIKLVTAAGVNWGSLQHAERVNFVMTLGVGIIGVFLSLLGVFLAGQAIALSERANELSGKATSIAEKQDRLFEEERAKRSKFRLSADSVFKHPVDGPYQLWLTNVGGRTSRGYFYLGVPKPVGDRVTITPAAGFEEVEVQHDADIQDNPFDDPLFSHFHDDYVLRKFRVINELDPRDRRQCATVAIQLQPEDNQMFHRVFMWFTNTPDERDPTRSVGKLLLANVNHHWIKYGGDVHTEAEKFFDSTKDVIAVDVPGSIPP